MKKIILLVLFAGLYLNKSVAQCACCGSPSGFSGGDLSPGASSLGRNQWQAEAYYDYRAYSGISHSVSESNSVLLPVKNTHIATAIVRYGINNRTMLFVQQPAFLINTSQASTKTFGDVLTLVNYRVLNYGSFCIDAQAGIEWPTGTLVMLSNGSSISTGSGSYDPVAGLAVRKTFERSFVRASTFFKYTTKGFNGTYFGNFFGQQLNYGWFLTRPANICSPDSVSSRKNKLQASLNLMLSGEWTQAQMKDHGYIANTGSYLALGSAGITFIFKTVSVPVLVSLPFYEMYHGEQNQNTFRIRLGITKTFN
jgi:hypothetical protein